MNAAGFDALWSILILSLIPLIPCAVGGMIVAVLQAVTQIQEQTMVHLMRVALGALALYIAGPYLLAQMCALFVRYFELVQAVH